MKKPVRVWALMWWDEDDTKEAQLWGVVTDESIAREWELRDGCHALAADLDVLPKKFRRVLTAKL